MTRKTAREIARRINEQEVSLPSVSGAHIEKIGMDAVGCNDYGVALCLVRQDGSLGGQFRGYYTLKTVDEYTAYANR